MIKNSSLHVKAETKPSEIQMLRNSLVPFKSAVENDCYQNYLKELTNGTAQGLAVQIPAQTHKAASNTSLIPAGEFCFSALEHQHCFSVDYESL